MTEIYGKTASAGLVSNCDHVGIFILDLVRLFWNKTCYNQVE